MNQRTVPPGLSRAARRTLVAAAVVATSLGGALAPSGAAPAPAPLVQVNFQAADARVPGGYVADIGEGFDESRGYGWVEMTSSSPVSLVGNGRDRDLEREQRRDTLVHMQLKPGAPGVATPGRWEHALSPGTYDVVVVVGDPAPYDDSRHSLAAEGVPLVTDFVPSGAERLKRGAGRVRVDDGRLTLSPEGGTNTKLAYVLITRVADAAASPPPSALTLHPGSEGRTVTTGTQGLSFEVLDMVLPQFTSGNLRAHLRTLGQGTLRIGGNSADQTFWTSTDEAAPAWATGRVTPEALDRLAQLTADTGWDVILTVNLARFDPDRAADEVASAAERLGVALQAVEIGNEPNFYYRDTARFWADHQAYRSAISARAPQVAIVGPGGAYSAGAFHSAYLQRESGAPTIAAVTRHFYSLSACNGATPALADLLSPATYSAQKAAGRSLAADGARLGVPAIMDETNNVVCQGQPGVSDVFASALWTLSHLTAVSAEGVASINIHGNVRQCGTPKPNFMYYTPLCAPTAEDFATGTLRAQPEMYGLLAFRQLGTGSYVKVDNADWATLRAAAVEGPASTSLALVNVQDPSTTGPRTVDVALAGAFTRATRVDLATGSVDGLGATTGITFGGQSVRADGTLPTPVHTEVPIIDGHLVLTVPAGSATIITLS